MPQVEKKPAVVNTIPASTIITLTFSELIDMIRKEVDELPKGGLFEVRVNPDTERVIITHT